MSSDRWWRSPCCSGAASPETELILLIVFVVLAVGIAFVASDRSRPGWSRRCSATSARPPSCRSAIVLLLITGLVLVASSLSLEVLLGAFAAGLIVRIAFSREQADAMQPRLESIGFGFLIPVFFVVSGMEFHARELFDNVSTLERVPIYLGLFLWSGACPPWSSTSIMLGVRQRAALGILQSTALPLLVVITQIGLATHHMLPVNATALVGAGMVSVLVFPLVGFAVAGEGRRVRSAEELLDRQRPGPRLPVTAPSVRPRCPPVRAG